MKKSLASLLILAGTLALTDAVFAAAFQLYELGVPTIGAAGVGQAAITDDASTAYFNPAGMGYISGAEVMLGAQVMAPDIKFSKKVASTVSGDNGGNAGALLPGMNMFFVYGYSPCLKFGLSVTTPYGGALNYNDGWAGRYSVQNAFFYTINLNPSVAYRFNDWLAVGAGVSLEYMNLQQTTAIPVANSADAQINLKVDDYAPGFNLGMTFTPNPSTKIGIAYRSKIKHNLDGNLTFLRISAIPGVSTQMIMPQNVMLSLAQDVTDQVTLLAEAGWANWSTMKNTALDLANVSAIIPRNWKDTYRFGVGAQVKITPDLVWQAGASYDSSPTTAEVRLPDLPMDQQIRVGTGVIYSLIKPVKIAFSYEYLNFGRAEINSSSSNGLLLGDYSRNYANVVQVSINVCSEEL